ncbi:patatin-like phospholipase domain-containing protein 7 isoform X2 [Mizuhopecten yessoensis]|uniref:patatin-like phospholipase domain-containing protein 7 isoform X2 n=1 Tax=Mizuhopecten yessoensis TaxID=6573 RepID=UPI000B45E7BC|nr:patatin-like phospholipase domain-containing protein 7 isoform X2 [Mizuhopecten yessoensis]
MDFSDFTFDEFKHRVSERVSNPDVTMSIMIALCVAVVTILVVLFFGVWKLRTKVLPSRSGVPRKPRFRKRDKVLFYGRKMLRKVRSFTKNTVGAAYSGPGRGKLKNKQLVMKLAKRLLQLRNRNALPQRKHTEPPQSFLETDSSEIEEPDHRLPPEVLYMLRSTRVFGHFEKPLFLELVKHMESKFIAPGGYLFKIGDVDDSIYVVQSGKLHVYIAEAESEYFVKEVNTGDSIHSLLSILDVLTCHAQPFKTVSAKAVEETTVLRLPALAFQSLFERFPESLVRIVQIIMIRLQRVTFTALHNYLGLSNELISPASHTEARTLSIHTITPHSSPHKRQTSFTPSSSADMETMKASFMDVRRQHSEGSDVDNLKSDFDTARMRARALSASSKVEIEVTPSSSTSVQRHKVKKTDMPTSTSSQNTNEEMVLNLAKKDLITLLKLKDSTILDDKVYLQYIKAGTTLIKQGDQDASLIFLITGNLLILQQVVGAKEKEQALLFCSQPGEMVGALAVLTGEPSFFTIRSKTDVRIVVISKNDFYEIMRVQPDVVLNVAKTTLVRMTPFVRQIDFALDWMLTEAGKALFRQGDHSDSIYIVLTGRFRSVITQKDGKKELVAEYGRGELVGIVEVLTDTERTTTMMAIRDTECAKLPAELLNLIKRKYPHIVTRLIHLLGQRILGHLQTSRQQVPLGASIFLDPPKHLLPQDSDTPSHSADNLQIVENRSVSNLATVAVLPISKDVPISTFTLELQNALKAIGPTTRLTSQIVKSRMGGAALDSIHEFRLFNWLGHQEDMHRMTLYECDYTMTKWTKNCIRQADCILIVGLADNDPAVGEVEKQMGNISVRAQKELVLLHKEDGDKPKGTVEWLNARGWCSSHHHIRCPKRVFSKRPEDKILELYNKLFETEPDRQSDFGRLSRFLTGTSIGLVLGGGGARGLAHIGMIKAMVEAGIPIDMVGGTSMGSFIGAVWCDEVNIARVTQKTREWCKEMTSLWKKIVDLTYPIASMFSGRAFNRSIEMVFTDRQVEDLWTPYFCISTDISTSKMKVHTTGSLWRYVRASMSLSGYMPPLCDPVDGHLLLDGGYVNNLPADVMKSMGAQSIFAVDVGSQDETSLTNYGDDLSGWWLLWKRWNPWAEPVKVPDMNEIQSRLAYVSGVRQLEMMKTSDYCEYIRPPIDKFATLQFGSCDEISEVGYHHGRTLFSGWVKGGLVKQLFEEKSKDKSFGSTSMLRPEANIPVMAKFTDLAELVSKIDEPQHHLLADFDAPDDEYEDDDSDDTNSYEDELVEDGDEESLDDEVIEEIVRSPSMILSQPAAESKKSSTNLKRRPGQGKQNK